MAFFSLRPQMTLTAEAGMATLAAAAAHLQTLRSIPEYLGTAVQDLIVPDVD